MMTPLYYLNPPSPGIIWVLKKPENLKEAAIYGRFYLDHPAKMEKSKKTLKKKTPLSF